MLKLPWERLSPEEFEEFCHQLLGILDFRDREWCRGPGDRGRDIVAHKRVQALPNRDHRESWVVECWQYPNSLRVTHLAPSLAWLDAHPEIDVYLLITTGRLSPDARDWLRDISNGRRRRYRVELIERSALDEVARSFPALVKEFFDVALQGDISASAEVRSGYFTEIARRWRQGAGQEEKLAGVRQLFAEYQRRYPDLEGSDYALLYVAQEHEVRYTETHTWSEYRLWLANVGNEPVHTDRLTVYGEVPVFENDQLALAARSLQGDHEPAPDVAIAVDTYNLKVLSVQLPGGLPPAGVYGYAVSMNWPFTSPLAGSRYYEMPTYRFTAHLRCIVDVPSGYTVTNATLFEGQNSWTRRISDPHPQRVKDGTRLLGDVYLPRTDSTYRMVFGLVREEGSR